MVLVHPLSDQPAPSPITTPAATPHTPVQRYIDYLKYFYKYKSPILKESKVLQPKEFIHLNLVSNADQEDKEFKSACLLLMLNGEVTELKKKRMPMKMEDIGGQSIARHILVEGSSGMGKTMFSWELCRQWAEGKMLQDKKIVLLLQLRSKRVREAKSLSDLFYHDDDSIKHEVLKHIKSVNGRGVFLVLEGYDEATEDQRAEGGILDRLLTGDCLLEAMIMVTCRPLASDGLCSEFRKSIHQHIEVVGFNDDEIKSYVKGVCQNLQPQIVSDDILSQIKSNPFVYSIMYIPLQCATLTALYIEKWRYRKVRAYAPTTLTEIYTDLFLSSLIRYVSDHPVHHKLATAIKLKTEVKLLDLPSEVQEQVWKLSQLAAEGLEKRQFLFDSIPCDHMGLMQSAEEERVIGRSVSYCFLHLTLQEYLAALHWSRMGSEDMVRLVNETSLFPLDTLVRDGITKRSGYHWPALYFLSGLTKLNSRPSPLIKLLALSLKAADSIINADDKKGMQLLNNLRLGNFSSLNSFLNGRKCNPYFFQVLFETQSRDLIVKLFSEKSFQPTCSITTPIECFVTAWCVANSDPTVQWMLGFESILMLVDFAKHFEKYAIESGSTRAGSVKGISLRCSWSKQLISKHALQSMSSIYPTLEFFAFNITSASCFAQIEPFLCSVHQMVSLNTLMICSTDNGGNLPATVCLPTQHCPSLTTFWVEGINASLFQSLVLPNINTLTTIVITNDSKVTSISLDFGNFCTCLCQSTSLECFVWKDAYLSAHEEKELVGALEQISSLKVVVYNDAGILTYAGIRKFKQALSSSAVTHDLNETFGEKKLKDMVRNITPRPLRSLFSTFKSADI